VDFRANEIVLNPGETKNGDGRTMPLFGPMRECLRMQKAIGDAKFPSCRYMFFGEAGGRIVDFQKAWRTACKSAGVSESLIFHDLRRSAARNMRKAGVPENTSMRIGGWKTASMFRRYDIQDGRDLQRAAALMEQRLAEQGASSTISSTIATEAQAGDQPRKASKSLN
jgi:integrase